MIKPEHLGAIVRCNQTVYLDLQSLIDEANAVPIGQWVERRIDDEYTIALRRGDHHDAKLAKVLAERDPEKHPPVDTLLALWGVRRRPAKGGDT